MDASVDEAAGLSCDIQPAQTAHEPCCDHSASRLDVASPHSNGPHRWLHAPMPVVGAIRIVAAGLGPHHPGDAGSWRRFANSGPSSSSPCRGLRWPRPGIAAGVGAAICLSHTRSTLPLCATGSRCRRNHRGNRRLALIRENGSGSSIRHHPLGYRVYSALAPRFDLGVISTLIRILFQENSLINGTMR